VSFVPGKAASGYLPRHPSSPDASVLAASPEICSGSGSGSSARADIPRSTMATVSGEA